MNIKLRPRERDAIIQSLRSGVTPRSGLQHIQVGREKEVQGLLRDIDCIADGGAAFRLIIGEFGAGKSFFLQLIRTIALEKGLVTINADLHPDRRLYGSGGQARSLYAELMRNISTRTKPDGNAMKTIVERFISEIRKQSEDGGLPVEKIIKQRLSYLSEMVGGYDFALVIAAYWQAYEEGNEQLSADVIRWLRAEFSTKKEAYQSLKVRSIIDDSSFYDYLKLMALFVAQAGYSGLLVNLDEMVNLHKLSHHQTRISNYEQILRILNDCLQGSAGHIGFLLAGTPDFLFDPYKGLYSYEALHSRLSCNSFVGKAGLTDYSAPVLHLSNLSPEEIFILLRNLRHVFAGGEKDKYLLPDEALSAFLKHCNKQIGSAYFRTPRNTIKAFIDLLALLDQHADVQWEDLISQVDIKTEVNSGMPCDVLHCPDNASPDALSSFRL